MNRVARPQSVEVVDWSSPRQRAVYDKMYAHAKQKFDYFVARGRSELLFLRLARPWNSSDLWCLLRCAVLC